MGRINYGGKRRNRGLRSCRLVGTSQSEGQGHCKKHADGNLKSLITLKCIDSSIIYRIININQIGIIKMFFFSFSI
jgi:hypothetical protein